MKPAPSISSIARIVAITSSDNERSARLLETIGLRPDGTVIPPGGTERLRRYSISAGPEGAAERGGVRE